ncbi:hypothetical protein BG452_10915 [Streptomyces sp. CBMA123]|nr:hypothetical protein [Streptomyces sp. CBMA123]
MLELTEQADPNRLECPQCEQTHTEKNLGPLVLPAPTKRELMAALDEVLDAGGAGGDGGEHLGDGGVLLGGQP